MRFAAVLLVLVASLAHAAEGPGLEQTLTLSRPLNASAHVWLEVHVGPLGPGQRVRVTTLSGELLGLISPFGPKERGRGGVYSLAVPSDAIANGTLSVRVTIMEANKSARAPTDAEVQNLKLLTSDAAE